MIYVSINTFLWAAAITWGSSSMTDTGAGTFVAAVLFIVAAAMTIAAIGSVGSHMSDVADVQAAKGKIEAGQDALKAVKALTGDKTGLPEQLLALSQDNNPVYNPVSTYMELVNRHITNLRYEEERLARAQANIDVRTVGPFSFVAEWIQEPVDHSRTTLP